MSQSFPSTEINTQTKNKPGFLNYRLEDYENLLKTKTEDFWQKLGQKRALKLFYQASEMVPAYKDFLKKAKIKSQNIKSIEDFSLLPTTSKENYINKYPLSARCWNGKLDGSSIIASSSGTSGKPNYWPRSNYQEYEAAITHELLFKNLFHIDKYRTLFIIGFPMGVYVSGIATTLPSWILSQKYNASIVTAGNNKTEVLKAVQALGKNFEQIVLVGHPFFLKDVLESGDGYGIHWKNYRVGMMFCSEGFSEQWRDYVLREAGLKTSSAFNTYGSSEMLLMAYETPMSIVMRRLFDKNSGVAKQLLGSPITPNLFQYNPALRYIEQEKGELLFTAPGGTPLIRFNLHDSGTIIPFMEAIKHLPVGGKGGWNLPFLSVGGRSDYAVIFYAANIYPQHIHSALGQKQIIHKITGKFTMSKGYHKNMDEFLEIHIELKPGMGGSAKLSKLIQKLVVSKLMDINAEYNFLRHNLQKDLTPKIKLWPYQHHRYFTPGLKPRYIAAT